MKATEEFVAGKLNIGYVDSTFKKAFKDTEFSPSGILSFQTTPRRMTDAEIETELKPGICTLGDVYSFLTNTPEGCKDGYWNLFYFPEFVVRVLWGAGSGGWGVLAWGRDGFEWAEGKRVFSPATGSSDTEIKSLSSSETLALPEELEINGVKYKKV